MGNRNVPTDENCPYFQRTQLHYTTQSAIIAQTPQYFQIHITIYK